MIFWTLPPLGRQNTGDGLELRGEVAVRAEPELSGANVHSIPAAHRTENAAATAQNLALFIVSSSHWHPIDVTDDASVPTFVIYYAGGGRKVSTPEIRNKAQ